MAEGASVAAPSGFAALCRESEDACTGRVARAAPAASATYDAQAGPVTLTADKWAALQRLNRSLNTRVRPASDEALYHVDERWIDPLAGHLFDSAYVAAGDCEDVALAKRDALEASGWPTRDMFLAVGYHRELGLHTVLVVRTDRGDLVLDSRTPWVSTWSEAPYIWTKRQLAGDSEQWVKPYAGAGTTPTMVADAGADGLDSTAVSSRRFTGERP